jgi:hypothetical protein
MLKYELLPTDKVFPNGKPCLQLRALIDIPEIGVKIGDLGGFIEKENNLSHEGICWLFPKTNAYGKAKFSKKAVAYGGSFYGGTFYGGTFRGGDFYGGDFYGGTFRGGTFRGGDFYGGTFRGGDFYGGTFRGGDFYGGTFRGGDWKISPLQIQGSEYFVNVSSYTTLQIGCLNLTFDEWKSQFETIGKKQGYSDKQIKEYGLHIEHCKQWLIAQGLYAITT